MNFFNKETLTQVFSCEFSEISKNVFFTEHLWTTASDKNHIERIPIAVENVDHLFHLASQIMKANMLHLFLLSDGTRIDEDEYLSSLEYATELIVCTEEQIQKWSICFELKRYLSLKNISYPK